MSERQMDFFPQVLNQSTCKYLTTQFIFVPITLGNNVATARLDTLLLVAHCFHTIVIIWNCQMQ